jgi:acetolactate synthase-1/2/3 large subunit
MSGSRIFFETLRHEGAEVVFGYPGGALIRLYDELPNHPQVRHVLVRHEQAAVHAADGYARATGRAGVCLATSGPGATNLITGLASAHMDSIPVVAFTGQVATEQLGNDAFQEVDILGMTRSCTKHSYLVRAAADLAATIREAFWIATSGRPGPVLVDIPRDVLTDEVKPVIPREIQRRGYAPHLSGHPLQVKRVCGEIAKARRPVIYAGGGIIHSGAHEALLALAERTGIPVTLTLLGLGGFPPDHPLFLGMLGMHGTYAANMAVSRCDLLLAVGCRFDDRVTGRIEAFAPHARVVHIDIDPSSISKNVRVDIPIVGDARTVLGQILNRMAADDQPPAPSRSPWLNELGAYKERHPLDYDRSCRTVKPQFVIEQIHRLTGGRAIIATDVGQHQMWTAQFHRFPAPRAFLSSGGLGAMGYGLPAAIGAQTAFPQQVVFDIAGDGSIQMNIQELATLVQYHLPVKIAVLNNRSLGMVRQWQSMFLGGRFSETLMEVQPDFVRLAEAYGVLGLRASRTEEVVPCLERALSRQGPVLIDFHVDPHENVYPMVPPGRGNHEMILGGTPEGPQGDAGAVDLPA